MKTHPHDLFETTCQVERFMAGNTPCWRVTYGKFVFEYANADKITRRQAVTYAKNDYARRMGEPPDTIEGTA